MKNLHKIGTLAEDIDGSAGAAEGGAAGKLGHGNAQHHGERRHHRRSASGTLATATTNAMRLAGSTSPRASGNVRRNASTLSMTKLNTSQLRSKRNMSSGQLIRGHGSARNMMRMLGGKDGLGGGGAGTGKRRSLSGLTKPTNRIRRDDDEDDEPSPFSSSLRAPHGLVRFDIGDDEEDGVGAGGGDGGEDAWQDSSASQSPALTRSNSRAGEHVSPDRSGLREGYRVGGGMGDGSAAAPEEGSEPPENLTGLLLKSRRKGEGESRSATATDADADADAAAAAESPHGLSTNDATEQQAVPNTVSEVRIRANADDGPMSDYSSRMRVSQGSTLVEHTGSELVSRFMYGSGSGSAGTPRGKAILRAMHNRLENESDDGGSSDDRRGATERVRRRTLSTPNLQRELSSSGERGEGGGGSGSGSGAYSDENDCLGAEEFSSQERASRASADESNSPGKSTSGPSRKATTAAKAKAPATQTENTTSSSTPKSSKDSANNTTAKKAASLSSRTQQKLWLERASANQEAGSGVPAILPRSASVREVGGTHFVAPTMPGGRVDPRLQRQFNQTEAEYRVVRRFRSPLAEAVGRINVQLGKGPAEGDRDGSERGKKEQQQSMSMSTPNLMMNGLGGGAGRRLVGADGAAIRTNTQNVQIAQNAQNAQNARNAAGVEHQTRTSSPGSRNSLRSQRSQQSRQSHRNDVLQTTVSASPLSTTGSTHVSANAKAQPRARVSFQIADAGGGSGGRSHGRVEGGGGGDEGSGDSGDGGASSDGNGDGDDDDDDAENEEFHDAQDGQEGVLERSGSGSGGVGSMSGSAERKRTEAEQLCRRLWESVVFVAEE